MKTKVLFLIEKDSENEVFAYFPDEIASFKSPNDIYSERNDRMSYAHVGQHSACSTDYAKECKEATFCEYWQLKRELENIGYDLDILNTRLCVGSNQYKFPAETYYFLVNGKGEIWHHKDNKWRKKPLKELTTYYYKNEDAAIKEIKRLKETNPIYA